MTGGVCAIRFAVRDYAKLYVMDDADFLGGLLKHFFEDERSIDYHRLYSDGINRYTSMQQDGIVPILRLEEKIVREKRIPPSPEGYIKFRTIMDSSTLSSDEKEALIKVRDSLLHYWLKFDPNDWRKFTEIMGREGLNR